MGDREIRKRAEMRIAKIPASSFKNFQESLFTPAASEL